MSDDISETRPVQRRDILIGGACLAAIGAAEWLRPRRVVRLLEDTKLDAIVPETFGNWSSEADSNIIAPTTPGSLADKLYSDTIARSYRNENTGQEIMLLIAYGGAQSDLLQLHRPESCYPAVGFEITERELVGLPMQGVSIPSVLLTAQSAARIEDIIYWTRLGEFLPQTASQQRSDRLSTAMEGYIGDGILVRASVARQGEKNPKLLTDFMQEMVAAMKPDNRAALIGTQRAQQLANA